MVQPGWMSEAWAEFGVAEIPGRGSNIRILALYRDAGHSSIQRDDVPWCAAFVGAILKRAGIAKTGSLLARSYTDWGEAIEEDRLGAIAVLSRGGDPSQGHVGFLVGRAKDKIYLLGGNQRDAVTVDAFDASRLITLRWPTRITEMRQNGGAFEIALAHVLEMEGGYTDDPFDPGGPTNKGILLREYARWKGATLDALNTPSLKRELQSLPDDVVREIYRERYWQPAHCASLSPAIGLMHFDAAVNHGVGTAIRMLQEAAETDVDGEIGPLTRAAVKRMGEDQLIVRYAELRRKRYRTLPHFWRFGRGWLNRVERTVTAARRLLKTSIHEDQTRSKGERDMTVEQKDIMHDNVAAKWWGQSMTIWGVLITALSSVIPALGPVIGVDIPEEMVRDAGGQVVSTVQAVAGLAGTLMAIFGRIRAHQPLSRRDVSLRL